MEGAAVLSSLKIGRKLVTSILILLGVAGCSDPLGNDDGQRLRIASIRWSGRGIRCRRWKAWLPIGIFGCRSDRRRPRCRFRSSSRRGAFRREAPSWCCMESSPAVLRCCRKPCALAFAGYRVALVDLRGHGRSTGEYLTYGVREAQDVSQVIDAMEQQQLIAGTIGVFGPLMERQLRSIWRPAIRACKRWSPSNLSVWCGRRFSGSAP